MRLDWLKSTIDKNFDKFFMLALFIICDLALILFPNMGERTAQFIMSGPIIGGILMLITGNKKTPPSSDGPVNTRVVSDTHTEEQSK